MRRGGSVGVGRYAAGGDVSPLNPYRTRRTMNFDPYTYGLTGGEFDFYDYTPPEEDQGTEDGGGAGIGDNDPGGNFRYNGVGAVGAAAGTAGDSAYDPMGAGVWDGSLGSWLGNAALNITGPFAAMGQVLGAEANKPGTQLNDLKTGVSGWWDRMWNGDRYAPPPDGVRPNAVGVQAEELGAPPPPGLVYEPPPPGVRLNTGDVTVEELGPVGSSDDGYTDAPAGFFDYVDTGVSPGGYGASDDYGYASFNRGGGVGRYADGGRIGVLTENGVEEVDSVPDLDEFLPEQERETFNALRRKGFSYPEAMFFAGPTGTKLSRSFPPDTRKHLDSLESYPALSDDDYAKGGGVGSFAGHVSGPGSGTEDLIPAMLSDGEHVATAREISSLGLGSTEDGQRQMYKLRKLMKSGKGIGDLRKLTKKVR